MMQPLPTVYCIAERSRTIKKVIRKTPIFLVFLCLVFILAACSASLAEPIFTIETLERGDDGAFLCPGLAWGISPEEAGKALGVDLGEPTLSASAQSHTVYTTPDGYAAISGYKLPLQVEFLDDVLYSVFASWTAAADGQDATASPTEADFDALYQKAVELYGAPTRSAEAEPVQLNDMDLGILRTEYVWVVETGEQIHQLHVSMLASDTSVHSIDITINTRSAETAE